MKKPVLFCILSILILLLASCSGGGDQTACEHKMEPWKVICEPTCDTPGEMAYICELCGKQTAEYIEPIGHDFGEWVDTVPATCTEGGMRASYCKNDPAHVMTDSSEPLGHSYEEWITVTPTTCDAAGERIRICSRDLSHVESITIPPMGHSYGEFKEVVSPTCEVEGRRDSICANDPGHVISEPIPAIGHSYGTWSVIKEATATENGIEERVCKNDPSHVEQRPILATEHKFSAWATVTSPTCTEPGIEARECIGHCSFREEREIEPVGHSFTVYGTGSAATCRKNATEIAVCDAPECGATDERELPETALGHEYESKLCIRCKYIEPGIEACIVNNEGDNYVSAALYENEEGKYELWFIGNGEARAVPDVAMMAGLFTVVDSVHFAEGITSIAKGTVEYFSSLKTLYFPKSLTYVAEGAITGCNELDHLCYNGTFDEYTFINNRDWRVFIFTRITCFGDPEGEQDYDGGIIEIPPIEI